MLSMELKMTQFGTTRKKKQDADEPIDNEFETDSEAEDDE